MNDAVSGKTLNNSQADTTKTIFKNWSGSGKRSGNEQTDYHSQEARGMSQNRRIQNQNINTRENSLVISSK